MREMRGGFTLIEVIIALAIAAIVLATAVPAFSVMIEKHRLDGAASQLASDIHFARAEAARRGQGLRLEMRAGCYVLHTGANAGIGTCDCTEAGEATCSGNAQALKTVALGADSALRLSSNRKYTVFDPLHGTNSPAATLTLTAPSGRAINNVVNLMGRVRTCSPSAAAPAVPGYPVC